MKVSIASLQSSASCPKIRVPAFLIYVNAHKCAFESVLTTGYCLDKFLQFTWQGFLRVVFHCLPRADNEWPKVTDPSEGTHLILRGVRISAAQD